jgi:integrase
MRPPFFLLSPWPEPLGWKMVLLKTILWIPRKHRDIFIFMRETAVRISEACAVMVNDLDVRNSKVLIQRTWSGNKLLETTKGRKKNWMPLSDVAYSAVTRNLQDRIGNNFIFINPATKKGYREEFLRRIWKKFSGTDVTLYESMRHSTIIDWVQFANAFDVKKLARHSDIRVTDRYVQAVDTRLRNTVNRKTADISVGLFDR